MKVILLRDVAKIGRRFDLVEVPDGYASNQLIPKRWAEPATAQNLKKLQKMQADTMSKKNANQEQFAVVKQALLDKVLEIKVDANEKGHLFKAVNSNDIVETAKAEGVSLDLAMLKISTPIKELGEHVVQLTVGTASADIIIKIVKK